MERTATKLPRTVAFAPRFFVAIDDVLSPDISNNIVEFDFTDNEKASDELVLTLNNSGLRFQDDIRFFKGNRVKVRWGYPNDVSDTRQLLISEVSTTFSSGVPMMVLQAMDVRHAMNRGAAAENWGAVASSTVAAKIAKKYGLGVEISDSKDARKEARVQPANVTDAQFLSELAEKLHWDTFVRDGKLYFHPKGLSSRPLFSFTYFADAAGSLISFSSELNLKRKPRTGVSGANPQDGGSTASSASASETGETSLGDFSVVTGFGAGQYTGSPQRVNGSPSASLARAGHESEALLMSTPESSSAVIKKHAMARQARIELQALEARMEVIGTPKLRARQVVHLEGLGKAYSGNWRITQARHVIRARGSLIYSLTCMLKRNALGTGDKANKTKNSNTAASSDVFQQAEDAVVTTDVGSISSFSP